MDKNLLYMIIDKYGIEDFVHVWKMRGVTRNCLKYIDNKIVNSSFHLAKIKLEYA